MYHQVAKLFQNQEDLLQEFSQFLPDANGAAMSGVSHMACYIFSLLVNSYFGENYLCIEPFTKNIHSYIFQTVIHSLVSKVRELFAARTTYLLLNSCHAVQ